MLRVQGLEPMAMEAASGITVLGYAAATLTTVSFFPQALKTLRTGDTRGLSLRMYALFSLGIAAWAVYGVLRRDGPVIVANLVTLVPAVVVLERCAQSERARRRQMARPGEGGGR